MSGFSIFLILVILIVGAYYGFTNRQFLAASIDKIANFSLVEDPSLSGEESITIDLNEQNSSQEWGTAVLTDQLGGMIVNLTMAGAPGAVGQPAHIHFGKCPDVGEVAYKLTDVYDGKSKTVLRVSLKQLAGRPLAINVHKSVSDAAKYVSCGNLPL